jgi:pyoverdine/dityrosine biosynthesis protein Dit1
MINDYVHIFQDNGISRYCVRDYYEDSDVSIDKNFHARYGNNLHPLPPSIAIPKVLRIKTQLI